MPFQVTIGGQKFRTDDLTLDEAIAIEKMTGRSWMHINPYRSAEDYKAIAVTVLSRTMDPDVAAVKVGAMSIQEVLESIDVVNDDTPDIYEEGLPKAEGVPGTTGSSGPPADTDGPPR